MAEIDYFGVIRELRPRSQKFWGTANQIAKHIGISRPTVNKLLFEGGKYYGWRRMTEEEAELYYQPRSFKPPRVKRLTYAALGDMSQHWLITIAKTWNGTPKDWLNNFARGKPKHRTHVYKGTISNISQFLGITKVEVMHRVWDFDDKGVEPHRAHHMKGWKISRIHKPKEKPKSTNETYLRAESAARRGVENYNKDGRGAGLRAPKGSVGWDKLGFMKRKSTK